MKRMRSIFALAFALVLCLATSVPASASSGGLTNDASSMANGDLHYGEEVAPLSYTTSTNVRPSSTVYTRVAQDSSGFNCNVTISIPLFDTYSYYVDIGFAEDVNATAPTAQAIGAIDGHSNSVTYFVPSQYKALFIRIVPRSGLGGTALSYLVNVVVNK